MAAAPLDLGVAGLSEQEAETETQSCKLDAGKLSV